MNMLFQHLMHECGFMYIRELPTLWRCDDFLPALERIPLGKYDLKEWTDIAQKLSLDKTLLFETETDARTYLSSMHA